MKSKLSIFIYDIMKQWHMETNKKYIMHEALFMELYL